MKRNARCGAAAGAALLIWLTSPVYAQPGMGGPAGAARYDPSSEATITGTIENVATMQSPGGGGRMGQHLTLKSADATFDVHLGPAGYWKQHGFPLAKGDAIEVTGAKTTMGGAQVLLARQVKKGDKTVTLRDTAGIPAWSRGRRAP